MNRGLKRESVMGTVASPVQVTNLDPMNRGLKLLALSAIFQAVRRYKPRPDE